MALLERNLLPKRLARIARLALPAFVDRMDASSISARAARQQARTEKTLQLAADKKVRELVKEHPWLAAHFVAYAEKLLRSGAGAQTLANSPQSVASISSPSGSSPSSGAEAAGALQLAVPETAGAVTPPGPRAGKAGSGATDPATALRGKVCHRQYSHIHGCPVVELKALLNYLEPTMLHPYALRGASSVAKNHNPSKADLCRIIEFLTGMVPDSPVSETIYPTFLHLGEHMQERNLQRGRPCQLLRFPLSDDSWQENGVYRYVLGEEKIVLRSVIQQRQVEKTLTELGLDMAQGDL
eukprot:1158794-Amphidinium_carterae.1